MCEFQTAFTELCKQYGLESAVVFAQGKAEVRDGLVFIPTRLVQYGGGIELVSNATHYLQSTHSAY